VSDRAYSVTRPSKPRQCRLSPDRTVLDCGCGEGAEAVQIALHCAKRVLGIDMRDSVPSAARQLAEASGVGQRCSCSTTSNEKVDVVVSVDSLVHFSDPEGVLRLMRSFLVDNGRLVIVFGPTWYHPYGGHLFSIFPWAHPVFAESALIRWRSDFKTDGATRVLHGDCKVDARRTALKLHAVAGSCDGGSAP